MGKFITVGLVLFSLITSAVAGPYRPQKFAPDLSGDRDPEKALAVEVALAPVDFLTLILDGLFGSLVWFAIPTDEKREIIQDKIYSVLKDIQALQEYLTQDDLRGIAESIARNELPPGAPLSHALTLARETAILTMSKVMPRVLDKSLKSMALSRYELEESGEYITGNFFTCLRRAGRQSQFDNCVNKFVRSVPFLVGEEVLRVQIDRNFSKRFEDEPELFLHHYDISRSNYGTCATQQYFNKVDRGAPVDAVVEVRTCLFGALLLMIENTLKREIDRALQESTPNGTRRERLVSETLRAGYRYFHDAGLIAFGDRFYPVDHGSLKALDETEFQTRLEMTLERMEEKAFRDVAQISYVEQIFPLFLMTTPEAGEVRYQFFNLIETCLQEPFTETVTGDGLTPRKSRTQHCVGELKKWVALTIPPKVLRNKLKEVLRAEENPENLRLRLKIQDEVIAEYIQDYQKTPERFMQHVNRLAKNTTFKVASALFERPIYQYLIPRRGNVVYQRTVEGLRSCLGVIDLALPTQAYTTEAEACVVRQVQFVAEEIAIPVSNTYKKLVGREVLNQVQASYRQCLQALPMGSGVDAVVSGVSACAGVLQDGIQAGLRPAYMTMNPARLTALTQAVLSDSFDILMSMAEKSSAGGASQEKSMTARDVEDLLRKFNGYVLDAWTYDREATQNAAAQLKAEIATSKSPRDTFSRSAFLMQVIKGAVSSQLSQGLLDGFKGLEQNELADEDNQDPEEQAMIKLTFQGLKPVVATVTSKMIFEHNWGTPEGVKVLAELMELVGGGLRSGTQSFDVSPELRQRMIHLFVSDLRDDGFTDRILEGFVQPEITRNLVDGKYSAPKFAMHLRVLKPKDFSWEELRKRKRGQDARVYFAFEVLEPAMQGNEIGNNKAEMKRRKREFRDSLTWVVLDRWLP